MRAPEAGSFNMPVDTSDYHIPFIIYLVFLLFILKKSERGLR